MRLFLDANVMTYIAAFEGYLVEGTPEERLEATNLWTEIQGHEPDAALRREVEALRILFRIDDGAHFDWLFSDLALTEIERIANARKRVMHYGLVRRLLEHRSDVYSESGLAALDRHAVHERAVALFPNLPPRGMNDARQFCEAEFVDAYYFVTHDLPFIRAARAVAARVEAVRPSDLPFVAPHVTLVDA